jgi:hypothetical protein
MDTFSSAASDFGFATTPAGFDVSNAKFGAVLSGGASSVSGESLESAPFMDADAMLLSPGEGGSGNFENTLDFNSANTPTPASIGVTSYLPDGSILNGYVPGSMLRRYA